jgi:hypothetical protein
MILRLATGVLLTLASSAQAQPAPDPAKAFDDLQRVLKSVRVVWEQYEDVDRITTQKVAGAACQPLWTQTRVDRDGTDPVVESSVVDMYDMTQVEVFDDSVEYTTPNGSQDVTSVETQSEAKAIELAAALDALRTACQRQGR